MSDLESDIYYLKSIKRLIDEVNASQDFGPTLGSEILADNRDWLDCYIDRLERKLPHD